MEATREDMRFACKSRMYGHLITVFIREQMRSYSKSSQRYSCLVLYCSISKQQHPAQDQCDSKSRPSQARDLLAYGTFK